MRHQQPFQWPAQISIRIQRKHITISCTSASTDRHEKPTSFTPSTKLHMKCMPLIECIVYGHLRHCWNTRCLPRCGRSYRYGEENISLTSKHNNQIDYVKSPNRNMLPECGTFCGSESFLGRTFAGIVLNVYISYRRNFIAIFILQVHEYTFMTISEPSPNDRKYKSVYIIKGVWICGCNIFSLKSR